MAADTPDRRESEVPGGASSATARGPRRTRALRFLFHAVFVAGCVAALLGDGAWLDLRRLRVERDATAEELAAARDRVAGERRDVARLRDDPRGLERIAREQLDYARPGEIVFLLPPESDGRVDATDTLP